MKPIAIIILVFTVSVCSAQTKTKKFELIPFTKRSEITFSTIDASGTISISKNEVSRVILLNFGGTVYNGKLINNKIVLQKPYVLSYDTCRQTVTIFDTKKRISSTIRWYKVPIELTNLKQQ